MKQGYDTGYFLFHHNLDYINRIIDCRGKLREKKVNLFHAVSCVTIYSEIVHDELVDRIEESRIFFRYKSEKSPQKGIDPHYTD